MDLIFLNESHDDCFLTFTKRGWLLERRDDSKKVSMATDVKSFFKRGQLLKEWERNFAERL